MDDRGEAVPDLTFAVRLHRKGADLSWNHQSNNGPRTDASGVFTLESVPPGAWTLEAWAPGYEDLTMPIEVASRDVTLDLVRKTTIEVHYLRPDGTPLRAGLYHAVRQGGRPFSPYGHARGRVPLMIDRLHPGRYRITVNLIGRVPPYVHDLEVTPGPNDARTFTVPVPEGASVEGRLLDGDGAPLAGLASLRPHGAHPDDSQVCLDHPVGAGGSFRFEGLSPGRYLLRALAEDHTWREQVLDVSDADPAPIELRLHRGATLRVRLPRSPGRAAGRWQLQLLTADGDTINVTAPKPDEDDWLVFARLPAGRTTVLLESSSFRAEPVPNDPYVVALDCDEGQAVEHAFPRLCGVTLRGRVFGPGGKPRPQYKVSLHRVASTFDPPASMPDMGYGWKDLFTNDEGRFEAPGLLPGRYVVVNVRRGDVPLVIEVKEGAGQTVELHAR